jgi:hypothetical protein
MDKTNLLKKTIHNIQKLPEHQVKEVNDFVEFLLSKIDDKIIKEGIQELQLGSESFEFLKTEPDLYTVNDLKIKYK